MKVVFPKYNLGVNLGFAVNRYPEACDWTRAVHDIGVSRVQFVADLLNPFLPQNFRRRKVKEIQKECTRFNIKIESAFTGAFTRVNHFGSEDPELRDIWEAWFVSYAQQVSEFGVSSIGGHPGILSLKNDSSPQKRQSMIVEIAERWWNLYQKIEKYGISKIVWEPMSVSRELGHTINDALNYQKILDSHANDKFFICLDLDHGDILSRNPIDINPTDWIKTFNSKIAMLHLKQTTKDRRRHMSFSKVNNANGTVKAEEIMIQLASNKVPSLTMFLELGFRERNPDDANAILENKESVNYWVQMGALL